MAGDQDKAPILALFSESYNREPSESAWKWRYMEAPAGPGVVALVCDGERLASHYAASPVRLDIDGRSTLTALAGMTMTAPAYRGRGLFQEAARTAYDEMRRRGVRLVWGFPNNQVHRQRRRDLGWRTIAEIPMLRLRLSPNQKIRRCSRPVKQIQSIGPDFDVLWRRCYSRYRIISQRDASYLLWRFTSNPSVTYNVSSVEVEHLVHGYIVTKIYGGEIQIVDILAIDGESFIDLILSVIQTAQDLSITSVAMWYNVHESWHLLLEGLGFINEAPITYLAGMSLRGEGMASGGVESWHDYRNWYITMADSDVF